MQRRQWKYQRSVVVAVLAGSGLTSVAQAEPPPDAIAGSPRPVGLGLSPEAPPVPPAPGGRAPSFGAPTPRGEDALFRIGGNLYAWEAVGIGREPTPNASTEDLKLRLHVPALSQGRQPFYPQTGITLRFEYGTSAVRGTVTFQTRAPRRELAGYEKLTDGPAFGQAYLTFTPAPLGKLRLSLRTGAYTENFAGPGLWGWGIFGPLLAVRGFGASGFAEYDASPETRLNFEYGTQGVPSVPEEFRRGDYTGWTETGLSSLVHHAHAGITYKNEYLFKLHYARVNGTDERRYLLPQPANEARDGHMDVVLAEARWTPMPFGQLGVSGAYWNLKNATAIHDSIWWAIDWTKGGQDLTNKYLGPSSGGTGQLAVVSAQYTMSLATLLYHYAGRSFDGNAPDVRVALAGVGHFTLKSEEDVFDGANGYLLGADINYQMLRWFGLSLRAYGESRDTALTNAFLDADTGTFRSTTSLGRWSVYSISPGLAFRTDWQSTDRIELIYSRRFYGDTVDNNPAEPLDRHVVALGAYIDF
jgi:hypothetical protein